MFIGHFALGLGAKRIAPEISLGTLFLAVQLADLVWPSLLLAGIEEVRIAPGDTAVTPLEFVRYPWSHSLVALVGWGVALALVGVAIRRWSGRAAAVAGAAVVSHWLLDWITHRPDMPLVWSSPVRYGLGLWNSVAATVAVEGLLFVAGVAVYVRSTRARDRIGRWALTALVAFLGLVYAANLLGPPPPSPTAVAWVTQSMWLLVAWGYWIDRHRAPARPTSSVG